MIVKKWPGGGGTLHYNSTQSLLEENIFINEKLYYPLDLMELLFSLSEELLSVLKPIGVPFIPKRNVGIRDMFLLGTSAINKKLDDELYNNILRIISVIDGNFQTNNIVGNSNGAFYPDMYQKVPYIAVDVNGALDSVDTMTHELGYANEFMLNNDYYNNSPLVNKLLSEVVSIFLQLLTYDYFLEKGFL